MHHHSLILYSKISPQLRTKLNKSEHVINIPLPQSSPLLQLSKTQTAIIFLFGLLFRDHLSIGLKQLFLFLKHQVHLAFENRVRTVCFLENVSGHLTNFHLLAALNITRSQSLQPFQSLLVKGKVEVCWRSTPVLLIATGSGFLHRFSKLQISKSIISYSHLPNRFSLHTSTQRIEPSTSKQ